MSQDRFVFTQGSREMEAGRTGKFQGNQTKRKSQSYRKQKRKGSRGTYKKGYKKCTQKREGWGRWWLAVYAP